MKPLKRSRTRRYRQCTGQLEVAHTRARGAGVIDLICNRVRDRGDLACVVGIRGVTTALQAGCERLDVATSIERGRVAWVVAQQRNIILEALGRCRVSLELRRDVGRNADVEGLRVAGEG